MIGDNALSSKNILFSFVVVLLLFSPQLEAKLLITYGDDIVKVAELPADMKQQASVADMCIAYKYGQFGLFWMQIWTWSGEFCLYSESQNTYWTLEEKQIKMLNEAVPGGLKVPSSYSYPPGLFVVIALVAILIFIGSKSSNDEAPSQEEASEGEKPAEA